METLAVVMEKPEHLSLRRLDLVEATADDIVVDIAWSGISTGTERLLWTGRMPQFPGLGYPLVPGYESVGTVVMAGEASGHRVGESVFVPGSRGFRDARGLFGGAASRLVVAGRRAVTLDAADSGPEGVLMALAATAIHAVQAQGAALPDLIVGHGVLGRLLARVAVALGASPVVWEKNQDRQSGAAGYTVLDPDADSRRDYPTIYDVSGDESLIDLLISRLAPGGELVLAGFYERPIKFDFAPAFMREARIRIAAEWREADLDLTRRLIASGRLSLDGLITHTQPACNAEAAYRTAFSDARCLKMILDWRAHP
ncbi:chlorophyll synthesis pathway protein BchC [Rhabdaerophilum sp. SD176]|uniref:chlorophyll synthesis pathway protein BchC n=1 Tax=Rhabdaerophilum sp. SD176 TaxID=2983548 RepID=UPI0024DF8443|nr:chlorophyll synthesis pathway protein BchC [Rhabdaerophilum sp. SD176]